MTFLHPEFMYYMLPPMFILFGLLLTQKEAQATFFSQEVMDKLRVSANTLTLQARNALFLLMGVMIVIALSAPVIEDGKVEVKAKSADIMIALDISDSMLAEDVYPNRLKLAKQKAMQLLSLAPNERVGVIAFAKNSYLVSPLSFDHSAVRFLLAQLNTDSITEKGTNLLSMLNVVNSSVKESTKRYLLILSDGGDKDDFTDEIAFAKEKNISIFVLGIGTSKGAPIKMKNGEFIKQNGDIIISKLNDNISSLATQTGGVYIESLNADADIKAMLREIEANSEQKELKTQEISRFIPLFYFPLGFALLLLLIATSSMSKREKVHLPLSLLMAAFFLHTPTLNAGLLDFVELDEAKSAYESGDYAKSEALYEEYSTETSNTQSQYNKANSLYKQNKFKEAAKAYEKAVFGEPELAAKNYSNLGNAYAKQKTKESLQKALKAYEKSLKLKDDKNTKENYEAVKKVLEEEKKKEKEQNKDDKKKDKKDKSDKKDKQDEKKDKSDKDGEKSDNKDEKSKDGEKKESDKKKDEKEKSDEEKSQSDKASEDKDKQKKEKSEQDKEKEKKSQEQKDKDAAKELKDEKSEEKKDEQKNGSNAAQAQDEMSDAEEKKWLKQLNKQQNTYMYKLNKNNSIKGDENAKPW